MIARGLRRLYSTLDPRRSILRLENQSKTWSLQELEKHADAFSLGLQELGFQKGDKIVTWYDQRHLTESITTAYGCAKCGVTNVPIHGSNPSDFFNSLSDSSVKAAFFSPNTRVDGNIKKSEALLSTLTELNTAYAGDALNLRQFPHLKYLVHTGFYTIPGTYKFKDILLYANRNFLNFTPREENDDNVVFSVENKNYTLKDLKTLAETISSNDKQYIAVLSDANCPKTFSLGVLSTIFSNNYSVIFGTHDNILPVLRNINDPLVIHSKNTSKDLLSSISSLGITKFASI